MRNNGLTLRIMQDAVNFTHGGSLSVVRGQKYVTPRVSKIELFILLATTYPRVFFPNFFMFSSNGGWQRRVVASFI
jgi:hypothetical protein